jgi:uncharacterized protein (TIGR04255 family)
VPDNRQENEDVRFKKPPVVEVALSAQFEPLPDLNGPHVGLYWAGIKDKFPIIEQHPRLDPMIERFDVRDYAPRFIRFDIGEPVPRYWLLDASRSELQQIQQDRFTHNWRKSLVPYPEYEGVRESFSAELGTFGDFLKREGLGEVVPNQCEVTYINHIVAPAGDAAPHARVQDVLTIWSGRYDGEVLSEPEAVDVRLRYVIRRAGKAIGRLHIELQPAFRQSDGVPLWVLVLTARGAPLGPGLSGVTDFLDIGRRHALRTFLAITPKQLQAQWEREQ